MRKILQIILLSIAVFILLDSRIYAQSDSLLEAQQVGKNANLKADSVQTADSLHQAILMQQIVDLKSRDKQKREQLQAELDSLKNVSEKRSQLAKRQVDSLRSNTAGMPVIFFGDTLFNVYSKLGPFSPTDRAASIIQKMKMLVNENNFDPNKLVVFEGAESDDIMHDDLIILSVMDKDAFWIGKARQKVAEEHAQTIRISIANYHKNTGLIQVLKRTGLLILVILVFALSVNYMNKGFTWLNKLVLRRSGKYINGLKFRNYEFLSVTREKQLIKLVLRVIKWITIAFALYLLLPIVFSIFPATKGIASMLFSYVLDPLVMFGKAIIGYVPELIAIIVIIFITHYFVKLLHAISLEIASGKLVLSGFYSDWAEPTFNLVRIIIYAFSFIIIFPYLPGSDSDIFKGVSVFLGVLFSLGSSSAITNIIAGLVITYMRAFKIGDRVKIGDTVGEVVEKSMLVTRLRTIKNEDITIPNAAIMNGNTTNFSSSAKELGLILNTTITIGYDIPWRKVSDLLVEAATKTQHIKAEPKPFVLQTSLDDFYVSYQINAYTEQAGMASKIYSELHSNIQDLFNGAGVEIMSPHYRGNRDGNMSTMPPEYLPSGYKTPVFQVNIKKDEQD